MKKDEIYKKLVQKYKDSVSTPVLKEAAYNLAVANAMDSSFWEKAEKAISKIKEVHSTATNNPLSEAAKKAYSSALSVCPICKSKMNLVKLLEDREVFYCQDHKIVQPLPVED